MLKQKLHNPIQLILKLKKKPAKSILFNHNLIFNKIVSCKCCKKN